MTRYLEIFFRSKLRLLILVFLLPLALSSVDFYVQRSYSATMELWVGDPGTYGRYATAASGYDIYLTPAQNAARPFSQMIGTQSFDNALVQQLLAEGVIHTDKQRATVLASLSQLTVTAGAARSSSSGGGGGGAAQDHTLTVSYICKQPDLCVGLLPVALEAYRSTYADLKAQAAATARALYEPQLKAAQAKLASANDAYQRYVATLPPKSSKAQPDVQEQALLHDIDVAQRAVDAVQAQLQSVDNLTLVANAMLSNMYIVDGPKLQDSILRIPGFGKDNVKIDGIIWATCIAAAAAYLILIALMDRTVREPNEIKRKLGKAVVTIPAYQSRPAKKKAAA